MMSGHSLGGNLYGSGGGSGGNFLTNNPIASSLALGGIGGALGSMFGDYTNPAEAAQPYLDQASRQLPQYYQPYMQAGQQATPQLQQQVGRMLDPNSLIQQIGSGYQQSPGFNFMKNQGMMAANNAAASGGMLGTPQHQQQSAQLAENLANQDFYNYLSKALGTYGQGVSGLEGLYGGGLGASIGLGENLSSILGSQAQLAYEGQQAENAHSGGQAGGMLGAVGSMLPFFMMG